MFSQLKFFRSRPQPVGNRRGNYFRPAAEALEARWVPSTLHVGPKPSEFATIQAAVNAAHNGDHILIDPGIYQEQVTINKSIDLEAASCSARASTIILAPATLAAPTAANPGAIIRVTGSGTKAEIEDLTIKGLPGGTANLLYGIRVDGNAFADIENNVITNIFDSSNSDLGVAIDVGNSLTSPDGTGDQVGRAEIENNLISNYQRGGIVINHAGSWAEIDGNRITGPGAANAGEQIGVEVSDGAAADIECNTITGNTNGSNGAGIVLFQIGATRRSDRDCDRDDWLFTTVSNNVITGNDYGIFGSLVTSSSPCRSASAEVSCNTINGNTYVGVEFDNSTGVSIHDNQLSANGSYNTADGGIYLFASSNNLVCNNVIKNNFGSGIYVDADSTGNTFCGNQIKGSTFDITLQNADAVDLSSGTGTAGTANQWLKNQGTTFIDLSGKTLFSTPKDHDHDSDHDDEDDHDHDHHDHDHHDHDHHRDAPRSCD